MRECATICKNALPLSMLPGALPTPRPSTPWAFQWSEPNRSLQNLMHYRSYGSNLGRFMKPDNITGNPLNPQSWNLYSYVRGNPVNFNDPTGHKPTSPKGITYIYDDPDVGDTDTPSFYQRTRTIIPGAHDAEEGSSSYQSFFSIVNVHVTVWTDSKMSKTDQEKALIDFKANTIASVVSEFGVIGIFIDFSSAGEAELKISSDGEIFTNNFRYGGLNLYLTDQYFGADAIFGMGSGHTGSILVNTKYASSFDVGEEFLHAFGIRPPNIIDDWTPYMDYLNISLKCRLLSLPIVYHAILMREEARKYVR